MVRELTSVSTDYSVSAGWAGDGFRVLTSRGTFRPGGRIELARTDPWAFVLVRRGAYRRRVLGIEYVVDADTGYVRRPAEERSVSFFTDALHELILEVEPTALDHLPDLDTSAGPFTVNPKCALAHRRLIHSLRGDDLDIELRVFDLVHECLAQPVRYRGSGRRSTTDSTRRQLVGDCVELLHTTFNERLGLVELARQVGASPYHLSRVFRETTGVTISQYRTRLRVHAVLDRLEAGDDDLATVAADAGFADHSHMTRTVIGLVGARPSDLRTHLGAPNPVRGSPATVSAS
jgi:AraC-like DNA-binding protein